MHFVSGIRLSASQEFEFVGTSRFEVGSMTLWMRAELLFENELRMCTGCFFDNELRRCTDFFFKNEPRMCTELLFENELRMCMELFFESELQGLIEGARRGVC